MAIVAIVCGYDLHSNLDHYVERIAPVLAGERCGAIVLSGGRTSRSLEHSEASAMERALSQYLPHPNVILEEEAMTTLDNILLGRRIARGLGVTRYVVVCDRIHAPKVLLLSALLLRGRFSVRAVPRRMPLKVLLFEPASIVAEVIAALLPPLRPALRRAAMLLKGISEPSRRSTQQEVA